tara:strand:+ start:618 stop:968 length:351 start_codon:yes stop_codon:yes gene_type:complete
MSYIDIILVNELINVPTTVNLDFATERVDISNRRDEFSVQLTYNNGLSVNMDLVLEVSSDGELFSPISTQNVTDSTGSHIFDVTGGTGTRYLRVSITVNSGSIDVQRIVYNGKRNH